MGHEAAVLKSIAGPSMSLLGVDAKGKVDGLLFELAVEQRYRNATATNIEVVYTFPVPWGATLLELEVRLGDKELIGVVVEKRAAEARYEEAIDKGDTAIMLERASDGLYTMNLGNLLPGEDATIRYVYAQTLRFEHDGARLTVPTVIAARYGDPADAGLEPHQIPFNDLGAQYPMTLSIELRGPLASGGVSSPSHPIAVSATESGILVTLASRAWLDRDFVLAIEGLRSQSSAVMGKDGEGVVVLASFCAAVPPSASELAVRLKVLIDCSGSMAGDSIAAAKRALHRILAGLQPTDHFSLSVFGSNVVHVVGTLTVASTPAIADVSAKIGSIEATLSGTETAKALRSVFQIGGAEGAADVLLITDGEIMAADALVAEARAAGQRVFVVGIGSAPAEAVLRRLADATGGACEFIAPKEDVEAGILRMFARLRSLRVERVDIAWPQQPRWTTPLPRGLFGGETIHVYAGFDLPPSGDVVMQLRPFGDGAPLTASAAIPSHSSEDPQLARMAALGRIAHADSTTQLRLAVDYRLLTDRTNFIVVHVRGEAAKAVELPQLQKIAQMHAAGWGGVGSVVESRAFMRADRGYVLCDMDFDVVDELFAMTKPPTAKVEIKTASVSSTPPVEIPATDWTRVLRALDARWAVSWLGKLPGTLYELRGLGIHHLVLSELDHKASNMAIGMATWPKGQLACQRELVYALLATLEPLAATAKVSRQLLRALRRQARDPHIRELISTHGIDELVNKTMGYR